MKKIWISFLLLLLLAPSILSFMVDARLIAPPFLTGQTLRGQVSIRGAGRGGPRPAPAGVGANAGPDRSAFTNEVLSIDGTASVGAFDGLQADGRHSVQWDFGYSGWTYEGGLTAPIAYPEPGVYVITLTVYNQAGVSSSDTLTVTVADITLGSEEVLSDTGNPATNLTNLQAAVDGATGTNNKVITLPASFVSRGTLILKHRTVANHCTIRTANHTSLPVGVSRVAPGNAGDMPKLEVASSSDIIQTPATSSNPARYYNFVGIHLRKASASLAYTHSFVNLGKGDETSLAQLPNHIIFDRCFFDGGDTTSDTLRGLFIRGTDISVVNCYFYRFKGVGIETQGILFFVGTRIAAINNFVQASTENTMSGGGDHQITGETVTDVVFRRNYLKKDLGWLASHPSYYGVNMSVKNVFEMKVGNRWSVQGNRFEDHWIEDQNYSITITVRNQGGTNAWAVVQYLDFSHNQIHKFGNGMSIAAEDDLQSVQPTNHVIVRHNVWTGASYYSGQQIIWLLGGNQAPPVQGFDKVYLVRNSSDSNGDILAGQGRMIEWGPSTGNTNFVFGGNIAQGFINHDSGVRGLAAFQAACSGSSFSVTKNGFYRSNGTNPADNTSVPTIAEVRYTSVGTFDLALAADSPFLTTGLAGARAGADVSTVNALCANVVSGAWVEDATPPVISSVGHGTPADVTATVTWSTDDLSDSRVFYDTVSRPTDTDGSQYAFSTSLSPTLVSSHSVNLSGLSASTTYFYKVRSANGAGLTSYSSEGSFATAATLADFVNDTFDEASDTTLASHVGQTGATWTKHPDASYTSTGTVDAATDRVYQGGTVAYYASGAPPSADYYSETPIFVASVISVNTGPAVRMDTTANTMYTVRLNNGASWELRRIVAGSAVTIASSGSQLPSVGQTRTVRLAVSGTGATVTLTVTVDGVQIISFGDTDVLRITAAGKAGWRGAGAMTSTTGFHLASFSAR